MTRRECPELHILKGAMGPMDDGTDRVPRCQSDDRGVCRFCGVSLS